MAAEQNADAAFASTAGTCQQPAHGASDLIIVLTDVRLICLLMNV